jgi:hypothetical protein
VIIEGFGCSAAGGPLATGGGQFDQQKKLRFRASEDKREHLNKEPTTEANDSNELNDLNELYELNVHNDPNDNNELKT